jgi:hypothetical protein
MAGFSVDAKNGEDITVYLATHSQRPPDMHGRINLNETKPTMRGLAPSPGQGVASTLSIGINGLDGNTSGTAEIWAKGEGRDVSVNMASVSVGEDSVEVAGRIYSVTFKGVGAPYTAIITYW